ncbi:MAG: flagellar brake protein [Gammaproteobacteria bacterium]|nr:flagellar brake protein [Gammaproteobacteria bacterium]
MQDKKEFKVKLGDIIQLQRIPDDGQERMNARIIGHARNQSIIISAPRVEGRLPMLREGQRFVVRMLQGSRVSAFESEVLKYLITPYPHVHLSQPEDVESIVVRGARRVETSLVVSVQAEHVEPDTTPGSANMLNTSATGALIQTDHQLGEPGDKMIISLELTVASIQKYLRIAAIIRNLSTPAQRLQEGSKDTSNLFRHGVEFLNVNDEQRLILSAFIHEQIVLQMEE